MPRKTSSEPPAVGLEFAASMRPRPDAAENRRVRRGYRRARKASMRPRPDAAENRGPRVRGPQPSPASMRPRPDAAENATIDGAFHPPACCFNEAAARCRGKLESLPPAEPRRGRASMRPRPDAAENPDRRVPGGPRSRPASMRPRPDAAENSWAGGSSAWRMRCFNEAAARCRGKRSFDTTSSRVPMMLQ